MKLIIGSVFYILKREEFRCVDVCLGLGIMGYFLM